MTDSNSNKWYLAVPYDQKDDAKKLGARWDPEAKKWYAPRKATYLENYDSKILREKWPVKSKPGQKQKSFTKTTKTNTKINTKTYIKTNNTNNTSFNKKSSNGNSLQFGKCLIMDSDSE